MNFSKISSKLDILQIITTLLQHVVGTQCLTSTLSDILPGETLVENSKTHRTSSNFNKPPTYVNCTQSFIICNSNLHMSKTSCTTCRAIRREKGSDREWPERRKMSEEESEIKKSTIYSYHRDKKQFLSCCAREKAASNSTSWGGGKRCQVLKSLKCKIW